MKKIKIILIIGVIAAGVAAYFIFFQPATAFELMDKAQRTGDYGLCEDVGNYKNLCVSGTELQQTLSVDYDCSSVENCASPECYAYTDCGPGGDGSFGCPIVETCVVDQTWLCLETGGVRVGDIDDRSKRYGGGSICECPQGGNFLNGYGCAVCEDFAHEETKQSCNNSAKNGGYFKKLY